MHEADGAGAQPGVKSLLQIEPQPRQVERAHDPALGCNALIRLDHALVKHRRQLDAPHEQPGSRLIADAQRVAKAGRCHEHQRLAPTLQQRVGCHGRAHLDAGHALGRDRLQRAQPQQTADAFNRCVGVLPGVFGQQLERVQRAVRCAPH